jgi:predicted DNA-binding transcriptional regulator AlpA
MNVHEQELISKKELLQLTGISFGQLYRWKRQNLIPESWFIKKSSFTGQETFFPKQLILNRIQMILEYKQRYTLDELTAMLSPQMMSKALLLEEVAELLDMKHSRVYAMIRTDDRFANLTYMEATLLLILARMERETAIGEGEIRRCIESIGGWTKRMEHTHYKLYALQCGGHLLFAVVDGGAGLHPDADTKVVAAHDIEAAADEVKKTLSRFMD